MNKKLATLVTLAALTLGAFAWECDCTVSTVKGCYAFKLNGLLLGSNGGPLEGVAEFNFDGKGNLEATQETVVNAVELDSFGHPQITGTYTVNKNCTGDMKLVFSDNRPPLDVHFVIGDNGKVIYGQTVETGILQMQFVGRAVNTND